MLPLISDPESLSTPSAAAETDATCEALSHRRRRAVLRALADAEGSVPLGELADRMTPGERSAENGAVAAWGDALLGTRRRVHISLRHVHVPMLADHGAVDFDPDANAVSLRPAGRALLDRLDSIEAAREGGGPGSERDPEITTPSSGRDR